MTTSLTTTMDIVSAVAGGLIMIKGAKMLHGLNNELPWYKDYVSVIVGSLGALSLWNGVHSIAGRSGLPKSQFCRM